MKRRNAAAFSSGIFQLPSGVPSATPRSQGVGAVGLLGVIVTRRVTVFTGTKPFTDAGAGGGGGGMVMYVLVPRVCAGVVVFITCVCAGGVTTVGTGVAGTL